MGRVRNTKPLRDARSNMPILGVLIATITLVCVGCLGTESGMPAYYSVTYSANSQDGDREITRTSLESAIDAKFSLQKIESSTIAYNLFSSILIDDYNAAKIADILTEDPMVCGFCRYGYGCPLSRLNKPACD